MSKISTSVDQSKRLIELGIDVSTADMIYYWFGNFELNEEWYELHLGTQRVDGNDIPAWSLTALLSIIKPVNDNTYTLNGTLDGGAMISFEEVTNVMFQEEEIIDAAFEMVCWLLENKKI